MATTNPNHATAEELGLAPDAAGESLEALDILMKGEVEANQTPEEKAAAEKEAADKAAAEAADKSAAEAAETQTPEEKAAAEKEAADKAAADAATQTPEEKAAAEKAAAEKAAAEKADKDALDEVELPPHTKPKSAEAFGRLKQLAKETRAALQKELAEIREKLTATTTELETAKKTSTSVPENLTKELEDLRKFRLSKDIESDPEFLKFDATHKRNVETIYKKLESAGIDAERIAKIKELGGPDAIDWEKILPSLPMPTRRSVESLLVANEGLRDSKEQALEAAKSNATEFTRQREEREVSEVTETVNGYLKSLPWSAEQKIPADATPEKKAELEAANKFARDSVAQIKGYLADRSPARFAELAVGTLIAYHTKSELAKATSKVETLTKDLTTKVAALTKERDDFKSKLDAIKRAGAPRNRVDTVTVPKPKAAAGVMTGSEALDALAAEAAAEANEE